MIVINDRLSPDSLQSKLTKFWSLSGEKIRLINKLFDPEKGSPVFTVKGKFTSQGWTEWTQGFQFGSSILQFDATGENEFLNEGRNSTLIYMAPHISHTGVHDHGFNNLSTYGNLLRLMVEGKLDFNEWEKNFYELALKISGAVQASRWTETKETGGFIYSFNGPHSLFVDTIRSCRILMVSHLLGHYLQQENDTRVNLLQRAVQHAYTTARYSIFYGECRDAYDIKGRTAHESVFNIKDGNFRSSNSQQGYSGFSTWTRGLAWAMCGFAEELELIKSLPDNELESSGGRVFIESFMLKAAMATCDFYIENTPSDGIPYWDTGAPNLHRLGDYLDKPANPYNDWEPVDSSAAAIGAQGLLRLGYYLQNQGRTEEGRKYWQAGLTIVDRLLENPYLCTAENHQGLILHSIYHLPKNWDYKPENDKVPFGESSMWGDYHAREVALYLQKLIRKEAYYSFYNVINGQKP